MVNNSSRMDPAALRQMQAVRSNGNVSVSHAGGAAAAYPAFTSEPDLNEIQSPLPGMKPILDHTSNSPFSSSGNILFEHSPLFDPSVAGDPSYQAELNHCFPPSSNPNSYLDVDNQLANIPGETSQQNLDIGLDPSTAPPWSHLSATQGRNPTLPGHFLPPSVENSQQQATSKRPRTRSPGSGRDSFRDSAYFTLPQAAQRGDDAMLDLSSPNMNNINMEQDHMHLQHGQYSLPQYHPPSQQGEFSPYSIPDNTQPYFDHAPIPPDRTTQPQQRSPVATRQQFFACGECDYKAKTKSDLNKHNARHQKRFKCTFNDCPRLLKGFSTSNDLDRHLKSVHAVNHRLTKDYKCFAQDCTKPDKTWPRLDNFKQHLKSMHKDENQIELLRLSEEWYDGQNPSALPQHNDETESNYQQSHTSFGDFSEVDNGLVDFQSALYNKYQDDIGPSGQGMVNSPLKMMVYSPTDPRLLTSPTTLQGVRSLGPRLNNPWSPFQRVHNRRASSPEPNSTSLQTRSASFLINTTNMLPQGAPMQRTQSQLSHPQARTSFAMTGTNNQFAGVAQMPDYPLNFNPIMLQPGENHLQGFPQTREQKRARTTPDPNLDANRMMTDFMASPLEIQSVVDQSINADELLGNMNMGWSANDADLRATPHHPALVVHPPTDEPKSHKNAIVGVAEDEIRHFLKQFEDRPDQERSLSQADLVNQFRLTLRHSLDTITNADSSSRSIIGGVNDRERPSSSVGKKSPHDKDGHIPCTVEGCRKVSKTLSGLKKHLQRHKRPFGCTFDGCSKAFGSKNDWKRHEQSQHEQQECWRCHKCYEVYFHHQNNFINHLMNKHSVKRVDEATKQAKIRRVASNYQGQFWCGFCDKVIVHDLHGVEAIHHRFDHIADHFKNEQSSADWVELRGFGKTKAALKEESRIQSPANTEDEDDEDEDEPGELYTQVVPGIGPTSSAQSGSSMPSESSTEQQSLSQYSSSTAELNFNGASVNMRPDQSAFNSQWERNFEPGQEVMSTRTQPRRPSRRGRSSIPTGLLRGQFIICCECDAPYNIALSKSCLDCDHRACSNCKVGVRHPKINDTTMMM